MEVADDGRGIDPELIRRKAGEKGLMSSEELAALSDEQILDLVFAAGFSTASEVSDISGRGVGMDVVHATIERIGGRVSLKSRLGAGTTVSLDLPINIALLRIMVVESGRQLLAFPWMPSRKRCVSRPIASAESKIMTDLSCTIKSCRSARWRN